MQFLSLIFRALENALQKLQDETDNLQTIYTSKINSNQSSDAFNKKLFQAEQQLLGNGLPMRPWYRHVIYAPGYYTGYGVKTMPGIREAIEENKWAEAQSQIKVASEVINRFAEYLGEL